VLCGKVCELFFDANMCLFVPFLRQKKRVSGLDLGKRCEECLGGVVVMERNDDGH